MLDVFTSLKHQETEVINHAELLDERLVVISDQETPQSELSLTEQFDTIHDQLSGDSSLLNQSNLLAFFVLMKNKILEQEAQLTFANNTNRTQQRKIELQELEAERFAMFGTPTILGERLEEAKLIKETSKIDLLTMLPNQQAYTEHLTILLQKRQRDKPFCVLSVDADNLKSMNDNHPNKRIAGDEYLKETSNILKRALRTEDFASRISGDEFYVTLSDTQDLNAVINRIQSECDKSQFFSDLKMQGYHPGLSVGGIIIQPNQAYSVEEVMILADTEMKKVKESRKDLLESKGFIPRRA